jgi:hypothetical protein
MSLTVLLHLTFLFKYFIIVIPDDGRAVRNISYLTLNN